jgi:hypothetical protein
MTSKEAIVAAHHAMIRARLAREDRVAGSFLAAMAAFDAADAVLAADAALRDSSPGAAYVLKAAREEFAAYNYDAARTLLNLAGRAAYASEFAV